MSGSEAAVLLPRPPGPQAPWIPPNLAALWGGVHCGDLWILKMDGQVPEVLPAVVGRVGWAPSWPPALMAITHVSIVA